MAAFPCLVLALTLQSGGPTIRAKIVDTDDRPLSGASAHFSSTALAGSTRSLSAKSDDEGVLRLELGDGSLPEGRLRIEHPGHATRTLVLFKDQATSERDLGVLELEPAAELSVVVLAATGELLIDGWNVFVDADVPTVRELDAPQVVEFATRLAKQPNQASGSARWDRLSPGRYWVSARHAIGAEITRQAVEVTAGGTSHTILDFGGADPERTLRVRLQLDGPWPHALRQPIVAVHLASGERRPLTRESHPGPSFVAFDVPRGLHVIESDWPPLDGWRSDLLRTGRAASITFPCTASFDPVIVDARTGARLSDWRAFLIEPRTVDLGTGGAAFALPAGDSSFTVVAAGYADREVAVQSLRPGEVRRERVELDPLIGFEIRVLASDGSPAQGIIVQVGDRDLAAAFPVIEATDSRGLASIEGVEPGDRWLRVASGVGGWVERSIDAQQGQRFQVDLPAVGAVSWRCKLPSWLSRPVEAKVWSRAGWVEISQPDADGDQVTARIKGVAEGERLLIELRSTEDTSQRVLVRCASFEGGSKELYSDLEDVAPGLLHLVGDWRNDSSVELVPLEAARMAGLSDELRRVRVDGPSVRLPKLPPGVFSLVLHRGGRALELGVTVAGAYGAYPTVVVELPPR